MAPASTERSLSPALDRPATKADAPTGHLLALDGVRGLAILMVICSHAFQSDYDNHGRVVSLIGNLFYYGLFGVDLFFVLSGFLITGILYDSLRDNGYFRKFYARRALRIFPLYYGALAVCLLLTRPLHLYWGDMGWLLLFYLQNLHPHTILFFSPGGNIGLYHFWSLAIEEQFYLVWPAVVFLVRDRRKLLFVTLAGSAAALLLRIALLSVHVTGYTIHVTTACRADSLLLGGALAMLYRSSLWPRVTRFAPWSFLAFGTVLVTTIYWLEPYLMQEPIRGLYWRESIRYSLLALTFVSLIAWALKQGSLCQRVFQVSSLRFLGKYSYGIYVLHVFVLDVLLMRLRDLLLGMTHSKLVSIAGAGLAALSLAVLAAWLSYHLYEKPFLRLKHHFDYKRDSLNHGAPEEAESKC